MASSSSTGEISYNTSVESSSGLDSSSREEPVQLSCSSSNFSGSDGSDHEPEGIHPFLYEPTGSSSSSTDNDSEGSDEDSSPRLLSLNW